MQIYSQYDCVYEYGQGVERDMTKATYYYELAAIMGSAIAW